LTGSKDTTFGLSDEDSENCLSERVKSKPSNVLETDRLKIEGENFRKDLFKDSIEESQGEDIFEVLYGFEWQGGDGNGDEFFEN
jgi:hypothetical protein